MSDLNLKLTYFDAKGRAELVRWILKQGNIPFVDERVKREDWPEKKKSVPGGKVPLLMVKDKYPLPQSLAQARYAAKLAKLVPENDLESAFVDALADTLYEVMSEYYKVVMSDKSEEEKKQIVEEWLTKTVDPIMERLNKRLADREWYVSDNMTWGDLTIGLFFSEIKPRFEGQLKKYPALLAHIDKILALPKIKGWLAVRPQTQF